MSNGNGKQLVILESSSPKELKQYLSSVHLDDLSDSRFVSLAINDPQLIISPFRLQDTALKDVRDQLIMDAVELLSLATDDIELDYQIFESIDNYISGVFVCLPKKVIREYISVMKSADVVPVRLTACLLERVNLFFQAKAFDQKKLCIIDVSKQGHIDLAIFNQSYKLLREITYENSNEARSEIIQSMRCACAQSSAKDFNKVCIVGETPFIDDLSNEIKRAFGAEIEHYKADEVRSHLSNEHNYFNLNLLRNFVFSPAQSGVILKVVNVVFLIAILGLGFFTYTAIKNRNSINAIKASYDASLYDYATELKGKIGTK